FNWQHSFTKADQDSRNQKTGATAIKVPETNGIITDPIYGYVDLSYYVWNFWWGYTSGWYAVNWVQGGTNGPATGSAGGCTFHFADITTSEPGGGTGTQTASTSCPPAPPPPCGCGGGGGSIADGSLVTMADHSRVPVAGIHTGDHLLTPGGWVTVTGIEFAPAGQHTMFDITASMPYFADGYLDPIYKM